MSSERVCQKVLAIQKNPSSLFPKHSLAFQSMNTKIMCACSRLVHNTHFMYVLAGSFLLLVDFSGDAFESYVFKKQWSCQLGAWLTMQRRWTLPKLWIFSWLLRDNKDLLCWATDVKMYSSADHNEILRDQQQKIGWEKSHIFGN